MADWEVPPSSLLSSAGSLLPPEAAKWLLELGFFYISERKENSLPWPFPGVFNGLPVGHIPGNVKGNTAGCWDSFWRTGRNFI